MLRKRAGGTGGGAGADAKATQRVIAVATGLTVVILITLALAPISSCSGGCPRIPRMLCDVLITGHQYWWEVEYQDPDPCQQRAHRERTAHPGR